MSKKRFKKGQLVGKVISGFGFNTLSFGEIKKVVKGNAVVCSPDEDLDDCDEEICSYNMVSGLAVTNYIPGYNSRIISLDEAKKQLDSGYLVLDDGEEFPTLRGEQ